jgi:proteasome lid subunit RPN8/RPN11
MGWLSNNNGQEFSDNVETNNTFNINTKSIKRKKAKTNRSIKGKRKVWGIKKSMIDFIIEASKDSYPKEFYAKLLQKNGVITEFSIIKTIQGDRHAIPFTYMEPPDIFLQTAGTVHSHPSGNNRPSGADLEFFRKSGDTHIIIGYPYTETTWQVYNRAGEPIELEVVRRVR